MTLVLLKNAWVVIHAMKGQGKFVSYATTGGPSLLIVKYMKECLFHFSILYSCSSTWLPKRDLNTARHFFKTLYAILAALLWVQMSRTVPAACQSEFKMTDRPILVDSDQSKTLDFREYVLSFQSFFCVSSSDFHQGQITIYGLSVSSSFSYQTASIDPTWSVDLLSIIP